MNCTELRDELVKVFNKLKAGEIKPHEAAEFANVAGKMISTAKIQVAYYALRGEVPTIKFLESTDEGRVAALPSMVKRIVGVNKSQDTQ